MAANHNTKRGLVFIPDISGFTELVRNTDPATGKLITYELLITLIKCNRIDMQIAEIEGDAIFFFKWESIPHIKDLYTQFEIMKSAFDEKLAALRSKYSIDLKLNLKAIAHYGEMMEFSIEGFQKLYGEVVIEAHRLLKNNIPGHSYLLITDELMEVLQHDESAEMLYKNPFNKLCEIYDGLKKLCFTYFGFEYLKPSVRFS